MSLAQRLHDPDRVLAGTSQAIEQARGRGVESIEPDDLLAGILLAVARFGIVDLGEVALDLAELGLRYDLPPPHTTLKPRYSPAAVAVFDRAARVARADGAPRLAPIHLLVALGEVGPPGFARVAARAGVDAAGWRRLLAAIVPPAPKPPADTAPAGVAAAPVAGTAGPGAFDGLLTPDDAARALGVHIQTLRGYIRSGRLPALRVAGERAIRIRRDDLAALLEHLRVGTPPADSGPSARGAGQPPGPPVAVGRSPTTPGVPR